MGRAPCCDKTKVKRGPWSPQEDNTLKNYVENYGTGGNWIALPQKAGLKRCGKSCRLRWLNYLRPNIKHGGFTEEEDNIILTLYHNIGSRWSVIASQLPGRTDNDVKNYWNTKLKKKLLLAATTTTATAAAAAANKNSFTSSTNNYINLGTSSINYCRNDSKFSPADDIIYHDDNNVLLPYFPYQNHQEMMAAQIPLPSLTEIPENDVENAAYNYGLLYPCAPLMPQEEAAAFSVDNNIINGGGESASWSTNGSGEYDTFLAEMVSDYTFDFQEKFCDDHNFAYSQLANNISNTDDDHQQQSMFNQRL